MKRYFLILFMIGALINSVKAQSKAIDTISFCVSEVKIIDENLQNLLDSIFLSRSHVNSFREDTLIWNLYLYENHDLCSGTAYCMLVHPFDHIMETMNYAIGFFAHKNNIVFVTQDIEKAKRHDDILSYSKNQRYFYSISINWDALWQSDLDDALKRSLVVEFAAISDYPSDILCRKESGIWHWMGQTLY